MDFIRFIKRSELLEFARHLGGFQMSEVGDIAWISETHSPDGKQPHTVLAIQLDHPHRLCLFSKETTRSRKLREEATKAKQTGYVYLMCNKRNGLIKIGFSKDPQYREACLQSQEPEIELLNAFPATRQQEQLLHSRYFEQRQRGEWFALTSAQIKEIVSAMEEPA